jgi:hypothetical protein
VCTVKKGLRERKEGRDEIGSIFSLCHGVKGMEYSLSELED